MARLRTRSQCLWLGLVVMVGLGVGFGSHRGDQPESAKTVAPRIWDAEKLKAWATLLAGGLHPDYISPEDYYAAPVDNLRTYPVYHPDREPPGYWKWLNEQKPQPVIEIGVSRTEAEWVAAGKRVFEELDNFRSRSADPSGIAWLRDTKKIDQDPPEMTKDGQFPLFRWVVDTDGVLKISEASCAVCHSRIMPDGSLLNGAPGNLFGGGGVADEALGRAEHGEQEYAKRQWGVMRPEDRFYAVSGVPWLKDDIHTQAKKNWAEDPIDWGSSRAGGTIDRFNGSPFWINKIADLIGVRDRRYLDATATHANRGPEDIARYGILVQYADTGSFGGHAVLTKEQSRVTVRPPDEAMYALGVYLYSLEYPPSPHPMDDLAKRGQKVFEAEGCFECHTPPLYTNNKLVAAPGFEPPMDDPATQRLDISKRRVGTDPDLALKTRKGTGYYRVPMLRGLWYRDVYEHSGSVAKPEDWFDPNRRKDDYVPTGWKRHGDKTRAVPGHKFGHDLSDEDKRALIAFLKTLCGSQLDAVLSSPREGKVCGEKRAKLPDGQLVARLGGARILAARPRCGAAAGTAGRCASPVDRREPEGLGDAAGRHQHATQLLLRGRILRVPPRPEAVELRSMLEKLRRAAP